MSDRKFKWECPHCGEKSSCGCDAGLCVTCGRRGAPVLIDVPTTDPVDYMQPTRSARAIQLERAEEHSAKALAALTRYDGAYNTPEAIAIAANAIVHAILSLSAATAARGE